MTSLSLDDPQAVAARRLVRRGILAMLMAVLVFSCLNMLVKLAADRYPITEVAFFRNLGALVPVLAMVAATGWRRTVTTRRPGAHLLRACLGLGAMLLIFWSYDLLPLADATALWFSGPLFLTALSVPLLGERVGPHRWTAVVVGFGGVLVMVRPTGDMLNAGALVAVAAAFSYAVTMIHIRQLSRTDRPDTIVFYFTVLATLFSVFLLPFGWVTPTWPDLGLLLLCGLTGGIGQYFLTAAYASAPASVVGPLNYSSLLWATLFGYFIWGDLPGLWVLLGAAVVIASGLYIVHRETVRRVKPAAGVRPPPDGVT